MLIDFSIYWKIQQSSIISLSVKRKKWKNQSLWPPFQWDLNSDIDLIFMAYINHSQKALLFYSEKLEKSTTTRIPLSGDKHSRFASSELSSKKLILMDRDFFTLKLAWLTFLLSLGLPDVLVLLHFKRKGVWRASLAVILKSLSF